MYDIKISEIEKSEHENDGTFLQTPFWCSFKARHGWTYKRFLVKCIFKMEESDENSCTKSSLLERKGYQNEFELAVLNRSLCHNLFSIAYIPLMPNLPFECTKKEVIQSAFDEENAVISEEIVTPETQTIEFAWLLRELADALKPYLPKNTILIRFDPDVVFEDAEERDLFNHGMKIISFSDNLKLKKSKVDIQPPDSTLVDLTLCEDEILSKMHQKWRYNIRLSEKKGVEVHCYNGKSLNLSEKIDKFYELTKETNARDGNSSHAKSYYLDLIKSSAQDIEEKKNSPLVNLYIASHEGEEIAAIMTLFSKSEAVYLYGASSNQKRNLMPNHALQWAAMKDAKAYGSKIYDMYGMSPEGKNQNHPMHGLYMFKANFGGTNIHRMGSWDVPLKNIFFFYRLAENVRAWYFKVFKKKMKKHSVKKS